MKTRASYFIIGILLMSLTAFGQNQEKNIRKNKMPVGLFDQTRKIQLEKDSKTEEVVIEIDEKTNSFSIIINSSISHGKLTLELYDPKDVKQGNFTIETLPKSQKKEQVNGNFDKRITEPQFGNWKVKIIPKDVTGEIYIRSIIE